MKKISLVLAVAALGGGWVSSGCSSAQPVGELRMHANESFAREEYKRTVAFDTEILRRDPNDYSATVQRGVAYDRLGSISDAQADYTRAVEINPDAGVPRLYRANLALKTGQPDVAEQDLKALQGLELETQEQAAALVLAGTSAQMRRDWLGAIRPYRQAIDLTRGQGDPTLAKHYRDACYNISECYYRTGNFDAALKAYDEVIQAKLRSDEPIDENDHYTVGVMSYLKGDFTRARQAFAQVSPSRKKQAAKLLNDEGFFASAR